LALAFALAVAFLLFAVAFALAVAFLAVIPEGNLLLLLPLPLLFFLSFPQEIRFCSCLCRCFSFCHSRRESASALTRHNLVILSAAKDLLLRRLPMRP